MLNGGKTNITVLGGGFGGLEAAFYLRMKLGARADLTLVSDRDHFLFKPNTIYIPFGLDPDWLKVGQAHPPQEHRLRRGSGARGGPGREDGDYRGGPQTPPRLPGSRNRRRDAPGGGPRP